MVMQTPVNGTPTLQFVNSAYSPGGAYSYGPTGGYGNPYFDGTTGNPFAGTSYGGNYYSPPAPGYGTDISGGGSGLFSGMSPTDIYSGAKSAGSFVSNGFNFPQSHFINDIGASLGFGSGAAPAIPAGLTAGETSFLTAAQTASGIGEGTAGILGGTASFSSALGAAGIGAFAGNFLGRIGGNSTGGSIGGGIGAGIGMAVGGPVGAVIGGLVGGIGGGFFGSSSKPTTAYYENYTVNTEGAFDVGSTGGKNTAGGIDPVKSFGSQLGSATQQAYNYLKPLGIDISGYSINTGINTIHSQSGQGGDLFIGANKADADMSRDTTIGWTPGDAQSQNEAIMKAITQMASQSGATPEQIAKMKADLAFDATTQGQAAKKMPKIKLTQGQFADYMAKFNSSEGTPPNVGT